MQHIFIPKLTKNYGIFSQLAQTRTHSKWAEVKPWYIMVNLKNVYFADKAVIFNIQ